MNMMGSQGDVGGGQDGVLPPIQPGMKKVESTAEIMNLTLHQVSWDNESYHASGKSVDVVSCFMFMGNSYGYVRMAN